MTEPDVNTQIRTPTSGLVARGGSFANSSSRINAELLIHGNSGCRVQIKRQRGRLIVEKSAIDARYSPRLKLQLQKQRRARIDNALPFIRIPAILHEDDRSGHYCAAMEYVYFHNSITFFSSASIPSIDTVAKMMFDYIDTEIANSVLSRVPNQLLLDKIESIRATLQINQQFARYEALLSWLVGEITLTPYIELPLGRCHGDLTFSNIMIASDSSAIALIDFLDSFLDSPIIDLAKIRQDTLFQWTLLMSGGVEDRVRFVQIMRYLDRQLAKRYGVYDWYRRNIDLLLALNILRIAPYAQTPAIHDFLIFCLNSLMISND